MSYAAVPPVTAPPPPTGGRPPAVTTASALLWLMGAAGLCYAIVTVVIAAGTVSRFRDVASGNEADNFVAVIWLDAALAAVLSILFFALLVVLGIGLRRGSRVARVTSLVICVLGVFGGLVSFVTVLVQRAGDPVPGSVSDVLGSAYPEGWIGLNVVVAALQVLAYLAVSAMLLAAPRAFFGLAPKPLSPRGTPPAPPYGVPLGSAAAPYGAASGGPYGPPQPSYGAQPGTPYGAQPGTPYGAQPGTPYGAQPGPS
ncbi:hypothetical protein, partial [Actinoplanes regularis]